MKVRSALLQTCEDWEMPYLFTLTIDRSMFATPEEAYDRVKEGRYIPRLLSALGVVRWCYVLEFQMKTGDGWPHWHVLIDLAAVKGWVDLRRAWRLWRDTWHVGGLDLSMKKKLRDCSPASAMRYITKYLVKVPEKGWPEWVMNKSNIRFVQASRSVGALLYRRPAESKEDVEMEAVEVQEELAEVATKGSRSMRERIVDCGRHSAILLEDESGHYTYKGTVPVRPAMLALRASEGHWDGVECRIVNNGHGGETLQVSVVVEGHQTVEEVIERLQSIAREVEARKTGSALGVQEESGEAE